MEIEGYGGRETSGSGGRMNMRYLGIVAAVAVCLALAGPAAADSVNYTVFGWGQQFPGPVTPPGGSPWGADGYPGDTVVLGFYEGTLDLTPGTYVQQINSLQWLIDYTYAGTETQWDFPAHWSELSFNIAAARSMSFDGGSSGSLSQTGLLEVNWDNDYLALSAGSTSTFFVLGYQIDVTPLGLARVGGSDFSGDNPWAQPQRDVMARFDVSEAIPEPVTMAGLMMGIGGLVTYVRKRRTA
jgi:hypothetical protein